MKNLIIKNKKGMSITIFVLVLMTLTLVGVSLISFSRTDRAEHRIENSFFIEEIYIQEHQIKFFVSQIIREVILEMEPDWNEADFKRKFSDKAKILLEGESFGDISLIYFKDVLERINQTRYSVEYDSKTGFVRIVFSDFNIGFIRTVKEKTEIGFGNRAARFFFGWIPFHKEIIESEKPVLSVNYKSDLEISVRFKEIEIEAGVFEEDGGIGEDPISNLFTLSKEEEGIWKISYNQEDTGMYLLKIESGFIIDKEKRIGLGYIDMGNNHVEIRWESFIPERYKDIKNYKLVQDGEGNPKGFQLI